MRTNYQPSKIERVFLLAFAFQAFVLFAMDIFYQAVQSYNESVVLHHNEIARQAGVEYIIGPGSFAAHGFDHNIPLFNLITFLI